MSEPHSLVIINPYDYHPFRTSMTEIKEFEQDLKATYRDVRSIYLANAREDKGHNSEHLVMFFRYYTLFNNTLYDHYVNTKTGDYFCYEVEENHRVYIVYAYDGLTEKGEVITA